MNHNRCASVAEDGVLAFAQRDIRISDAGLRLAIVVNDEILHVAGVRSFRIVEPVLFAVWIEMRAGRLEVGRIALGILMNMNSVLTGGHIVQVELDLDAFAGALESGASHVPSAAIFHVYLNRACKQRQGQQHRNGEKNAIQLHAANYTQKP